MSMNLYERKERAQQQIMGMIRASEVLDFDLVCHQVDNVTQLSDRYVKVYLERLSKEGKISFDKETGIIKRTMTKKQIEKLAKWINNEEADKK